MLLKRARLLVPFAAVAALLWACSGVKVSPSAAKNVDAEGRAAVAGLAADYQDRNAPAFFRRLDEERLPNYESFRNNTRQFLLRVRQISLEVIVDRVLASGAGVAVDVHWNRTFVDQSGKTVKPQQGVCSFVFDRGPSGALLLAAIRGQSPF